MPRQFLKKYMPNPEIVKKHKSLQFLGEKLHDPNLLHLNACSVTVPPLFYFTYLLGLWILNMPAAEFSLNAVLSGGLWKPFLSSCLILCVIKTKTQTQSFQSDVLRTIHD